MLIKNSIAGTLESNDIMVELFLNDSGRIIELDSPVKAQFGDEIIEVVNGVLDEFKIDNVRVVLKDKGALNFTIKARVKTAIIRGQE
ncbi:citrate lyase subunit gamma (acyl carrier protein) [Bacilli bacterium PM5-3]|nr:citrate lyase subunit gamma (acyl carrier protein) [Bacilli bacterium PM5-3]MDH6603208.1 citrate lyase subunit gamma (acyl carrier protein) [Bacilli bacterium PM5-9]